MTKEKLDIGRRVYERKQTAKEAAEENGVTLQTVCEVARFPYTKICENRLKSKAIQGGFRFFYGIQEVYN